MWGNMWKEKELVQEKGMGYYSSDCKALGTAIGQGGRAVNAAGNPTRVSGIPRGHLSL